MKTASVSVVALLALSTLAHAADLPSKKKPQAPAPVASNDFDGYASIGAGYNWKSYDGESPKGMHAHGRGSFYAPLPGVFGFHEVWHIFVLLAAAAHFIAVLGVAL